MHRAIFLQLAITLALLISGCGSTSKQIMHFPDQGKLVEAEGKARVYVIGRPLFMQPTSHSVTLTIVADKEWIGDIVGHSYLCWEREPGMLTIASRRLSGNVVTLAVEKNKVYYILANIHPGFDATSFVPGGGRIIVNFEIVDNKVGEEALRKSKPPEQR
jgi:hypothetical protein